MLDQQPSAPETSTPEVTLSLCPNGQVNIIFTNIPGGWWTVLKMCQAAAYQAALEIDKIPEDSRIIQPYPILHQTR